MPCSWSGDHHLSPSAAHRSNLGGAPGPGPRMISGQARSPSSGRSARGQGRSPGAAAMRHAGHEPAPAGSRAGRSSRSHGVMLMDRAGWHCTKDLVVPDNLTLVLLPARAPELNPVENIWQFLRQNWLSSRVFASYRDIVDHCCDAWNRLTDQPWLIMSIGLRDWANA